MSHPTMPETRSAQRSSPQEEPLTLGAIALLATPPIFFAVLVVVTPHPLAVLQRAILVTFPIAICTCLILANLPDPQVSLSFLVKQFFLGAVPVQLVIEVINGLMVHGALVLMLRNEIRDVKITPLLGMDLLHELYAKNLHPGKLFVLQFILPYLGAVVEEAAKGFLALRYLRLVVAPPAGLEDEGALYGHTDRINHGAGSRPRQASIGCRGVLACACTGALGVLSTVYLGQLSRLFGSGTILSLSDAGSVIMHDLIMFLMRLEITFYIGLAMAERTVLKESVSIVQAFAIAVCARGFAWLSPELSGLAMMLRIASRYEAVLQRESML